jgi:hypothetical protein
MCQRVQILADHAIYWSKNFEQLTAGLVNDLQNYRTGASQRSMSSMDMFFREA